MRIVDQIRLPAPVNSIALEPAEGRIAIAVGDHDISVCRILSGRLVPEERFPAPSPRQLSPTDRVRFRETKLAIADERTLLVARSATRYQPHETWVELTAIDLPTKQARGHFQCTGLDGLTVRGGLAPCPPHHALLGVLKTVLCIDLRTFQETCRAREVNEEGDVTEADVSPEEQLAPDGFGYDAGAGQVYVLCGVFNEAFLMRYRLEMQPTSFGPEPRRFIREARKAVVLGHDPAGLCLNPARDGVTASLQIMDELIDLGGQKVTDYPRERSRMLSLREKMHSAVPRSARLGCLWTFSEPDRARQIELRSEVARDFVCSPQQDLDAAGNLVTLGYRLSAGRPGDGGYLTQPIYLDEQHVVVGTPSGLLLCCNMAAGKAEVIHDFDSPINCLRFSRRDQLLVAGCEDGGLTALSTEDRMASADDPDCCA
jgi:hypothetical protein